MPRTLLADLAGAERAVSATLALLLDRERGSGAGYAEIALSEAAAFFAEPLRYGITKPGAHLGGGFPGYGLYEAREGWVAIAARLNADGSPDTTFGTNGRITDDFGYFDNGYSAAVAGPGWFWRR